MGQTAATVLAASLAPIGAAEQAAADSKRSRESFDFGWRFQPGDSPQGHLVKLNDSNWRLLDLPHDWSIEGEFGEKELAQGSLPTGIGWYRKRFKTPGAAKGRIVTLEFDGIYERGEVWINEHRLGLRPNGYSPVVYDITEFLKADGENVVAVKVNNSLQPNSRWYTGSGIYRHTWITITDPLHVANWGVFVTTPSVTANRATVQVKTTVRNDGKQASVCTLRTTIVDADGKQVQSVETSMSVAGNDDGEFLQTLQVEKPSLWSVETPTMYNLVSTILENKRIVDETATPFGIREAIFDAKRGFLLNGRQVKLNGVCLHHDAGAVGAAVPTRVWERRLELLKAMGCNAIRTSHNPPSADFMDLCDRMGFLVMAEVFDEWKVAKFPYGPKYSYVELFDEWYERDVTDYVRRDRNHPSIVLWSAGNEIPDQSYDSGAETLRKVLEVFRREDPTRMVTMGLDHMASDPPSGRTRADLLAQLDIVGYNYVSRWGAQAERYYAIDREAHPDWRVIGTEHPSMGGGRGDYGPLVSNVIAPVRGSGLGYRRMLEVEGLWRFTRLHDYVSGDFMWTGIDYLGEATWPQKGSSAGVIDTCGFLKDGYFFYQSQWTTAPMLHIMPHWNWKGSEGKVIPVIIFTNCDSVELFLNGKSLGAKGYAFPRSGFVTNWGEYPSRSGGLRTTADLHLAWDVVYEPGTLTAVGTRDGKVVTTTEVFTTGVPAGLSLSADRTQIRADRRDVAHFTVAVVDAQGRTVPDANSPIEFSLQGAGTLIGVDNGDMSSHEPYKANRRRAFNGLALAMVQSTDKSGPLTLTVTSEGLGSKSVTVNTVR
jgi:beta-galactosidase